MLIIALNYVPCILFYFINCFCQLNIDFDVLLTVHPSIFISVINQLDAQKFCFTISLFHASTCFEHMCSYLGVLALLGLLHKFDVLLNVHLSQPVHETATYRCDDTRGFIMQF